MDRPIGVTILAIITLVAGVIGLCIPIVLLITSGFGAVGISDELTGLEGPLVFFVSIVLLFIGPILYLVFSYGALSLRRWAWGLGVFASAASLVGNVLNLFGSDQILPIIVSGIFDAIILVYLLTPHVRHAFSIGRKTTGPSAA